MKKADLFKAELESIMKLQCPCSRATSHCPAPENHFDSQSASFQPNVRPKARSGFFGRLLWNPVDGWALPPNQQHLLLAGMTRKAPILCLGARAGRRPRAPKVWASDMKLRVRILLARLKVSLWSLRSGKTPGPRAHPSSRCKSTSASGASEPTSGSSGTSSLTTGLHLWTTA